MAGLNILNHLLTRETQLFRRKPKEKVRTFDLSKITRQSNSIRITNRRKFQNIDFETNDYIVYKTEE